MIEQSSSCGGSPDDEVLGFGGAGSVLTAGGGVVQPIILCGDVDFRL